MAHVQELQLKAQDPGAPPLQYTLRQASTSQELPGGYLQPPQFRACGLGLLCVSDLGV